MRTKVLIFIAIKHFPYTFIYYIYCSIGGGLDSIEQLDASGRFDEVASRHRAVGEQDTNLRHSEEAHRRSQQHSFPFEFDHFK